MKRRQDAQCDLCEYAEIINGGDSCICRIRGIVSPEDVCRKFCFDPLKIKVSPPLLPDLSSLADLAKKDL